MSEILKPTHKAFLSICQRKEEELGRQLTRDELYNIYVDISAVHMSRRGISIHPVLEHVLRFVVAMALILVIVWSIKNTGWLSGLQHYFFNQ